MFLSRLLSSEGRTVLAVRQGSEAATVLGDGDLAALAFAAAGEGISLADALLRRGLGDPVDIAALLSDGRLLPPVPQGRLDLLPAGPAEEVSPSLVLPPGAALGIGAGDALEGGPAAVSVMGRDGQAVTLGWVQTHVRVASGGRGRRSLSCGPELLLAGPGRPGAGQTSLLRDGACITQFAIPDADRAGQTGVIPLPADLPEGTVLLQRLSRWLLRPGADHLQAEVESRIAGLGLPLRNPIGNGAAYAEKGADRVRRKA